MTSRRTGLLLAAVLVVSAPAFATRNASANGEWISFGVPTRINVGSTGAFYMMGNDMGSCASTTPVYVRSDMEQPHWKEFYAMVILAQANQRPMECLVASGCGSNEVWVTYCTLPF
jgi:hypothetical protein